MGVGSLQTGNNRRAMKWCDKVLYYHSVNGKAVVGVAVVSREAFPDPPATSGDWTAVEIKPIRPVNPPVKLEHIKADPKLAQIPLLRQARLSVMSLTKQEFDGVLGLAARDS